MSALPQHDAFGSPLGAGLADSGGGAGAALHQAGAPAASAADKADGLASAAASGSPGPSATAAANGAAQIQQSFAANQPSADPCLSCQAGGMAAVDYGNIPDEHQWRYDRYLNSDTAKKLGPDQWLAKAETAWANNAAGNAFEQAVRAKMKAPLGKGSKPVSIAGFVPDLPVGAKYGVTDVKNLIDVSHSDQLRAFAAHAEANALPFNLVVGPRTKSISGPVLDSVRKTGGRIMHYDPDTTDLSVLPLPKSGPWKKP